MFFTKTAYWIAYILFGFSVFQLGFAATVAFGTTSTADRQAAALRYLGEADTGAAIDEAIYRIGIAVALGVIAEISRSVAQKA